MADYYSLLARAVASLPQSTPQTRAPVYERARKALMAQLQKMTPPVREADIARETGALDEAVVRLERELTPQAEMSAPAQEGSAIVLASTLVPAPVVAPTASAKAPPIVMAPQKTEPSGKIELPKAGFLKPEPLKPEPSPETAPEARLEQRKPAVATIAPKAPFMVIKPPKGRNFKLRMALIGAAVIGVAGMAVAAFYLPNPPFNHIAETNGQQPAQKPVEAAQTKISGRAGDNVSAPATVAENTPSSPPAQAVPLPISQPANLSLGIPGDSNGFKDYPGEVVWRLVTTPESTGQSNTYIVGEISLPNAQMKATVQIQANNDTSMSLAYTVRLLFTLTPQSLVKGFSKIDPILRVRDEGSNTPISINGGVAAQIDPTAFLIGFPQTIMPRIEEMLKSRQWIDFVLFDPEGRAGVLQLKKGPDGDRVFAQAFALWHNK